jgi:pimeloyl-ACP methyl ester carboxylesterase
MGATLQTTALRSAFGLMGYVSTNRSARLASRLFSTPRSRPFTSEDRVLLETGQALSLRCGLAATVWGEQEGETILLVHGWQRHRASLGHFVQPLVATGKRVIAFDAPAHGDSPGKQTNPLEYAQTILAVGEELGNLDGIIAHSMGGGATLLALSQGLQAKRIVLLASAADWEYQMRFFARYVGLPAKATQRLIAILEEQAQMDIQKLNSDYVCRTLTQPTLLFHDPEDKRVPYQDSVAIAKNMAQAQLVTVHKLGHGGVLEDKDVIEQAVSFLTEGEAV